MFALLFALRSSRVFLADTFLYVVLRRPQEKSLVAWVDDEPALLVSYRLTHPLREWGVVDERRMETADRVARYQTDYYGRP